MQQLITGLLLVIQIPFNMFRASLYPSPGDYQLQQQLLFDIFLSENEHHMTDNLNRLLVQNPMIQQCQ
jgi:hypothetical protein